MPSIDISDRMKRYRFENIKRVTPIAFHGDNEAGGLPFFSFIMRKPKPCGAEFKYTSCTETAVNGEMRTEDADRMISKRLKQQ